MWNPPADRAPAGLTNRNCGLAPLLAGWKMVWPPGREVTYKKKTEHFFFSIISMPLWCGVAQSWCGVAQLWCGVTQLVARRLAVRQVRVDSRLGTTGRCFPLSIKAMRKRRKASANGDILMYCMSVIE